MKQMEQTHGFTVTEIRPLTELKGEMYRLTHDKTGLELVWLKREEENKTFGIAFETLPWNDTGVFHILEHSVLCGSDRYPVKEPFVELMKNSMNTFLNAMTFPDKTVYPISSRNDKDFLNLMRVYLDAVFYPLIYGKPEIFHQEGWHYEFDGDSRPSYKGVVFNEMKGAFADADQLLNHQMNQLLFPDNCYQYESGGDPARIPDLSYEEFLDSHRRFYAPSNGYVFLDGDLDIDTVLQILDEEYLQKFDKTERIAPPRPQEPVNGGLREVEYELSAEEDEEGHVRMAWGNVIGSFQEREKLVAVQILAEALCGNNQSPLCKAILSEGLAEDVLMQPQDGVLQTWVQLEVQNLKEEDRDRVKQVVFDTLARQADDGIDRELLLAVMTNIEFRMRERDFGTMPQGLVLGFQALESWLYGGDPAANLEVGDLFHILKEKMEQGYFEQLIREVFLENPHTCQVVLVPSHQAGEKRNALEAKRLAQEEAAWDAGTKQGLLDSQQRLEQWQASEDSPEDLAKLPTLTLADIPREPEFLPIEETRIAGIPVLLHQVDSNGILYVKLYFDVFGYNEEELSALSMMCALYGKLSTRSHSVEELTNMARLRCGQMSFSLASFGQEGKNDTCNTKLCVSFSCLEEHLEEALQLVEELLTETRYEAEQDVLDLIRQNRQQMFQGIVMSGSMIALGRLAAQKNLAGVAAECTGGFAFYQWLKKQDDNWDWKPLKQQFEAFSKEIIGKNRLIVSVTGAADTYAKAVAEQAAAAFLDCQAAERQQRLKVWDKVNEGIVIPADISFAAAGGDLLGHGGHYTGDLPLAARMISLAYLWNVIRVQGGAYGTGLAVRETGLAACYSYRDPSAARSLEYYQKAADFLRDFCGEGTDLTGFIIGAVSDASPLMTPRMKGGASDSFYFRGITWERRCKLRQELLDASTEGLLRIADQLRVALAEGSVCVIGAKQQLEACQGLERFYQL